MLYTTLFTNNLWSRDAITYYVTKLQLLLIAFK